MFEEGYTLIELLAVITVISIVVVVSPVSRNIYRSIKTFIVVQNIMMDFRWARFTAIDQNRELKIRVYSHDDIYKRDQDLKKDYIIYDESSKKIMKEGTYPNYLILYKNLNPKRITADYYDRIEFKYEGTALHGTIGLKHGSQIFQIVVSQLGRVRLAKE